MIHEISYMENDSQAKPDDGDDGNAAMWKDK